MRTVGIRPDSNGVSDCPTRVAVQLLSLSGLIDSVSSFGAVSLVGASRVGEGTGQHEQIGQQYPDTNLCPACEYQATGDSDNEEGQGERHPLAAFLCGEIAFDDGHLKLLSVCVLTFDKAQETLSGTWDDVFVTGEGFWRR